ncbi:MAG: CAP domain-containing protein [Myxococcota bacterium]
MAVALCACAHGRRSDAPSGTATIVTPEQVSPAVVYAPRSRASLQYNGELPASAEPTSDLVNALTGMVQRHANALGQPPPGLDPRLCTVAEDMARLSGTGRPPPYRAIEFALARYGVVEPSPQLVILRTREGESLDHVVAELERQIDSPLRSMPPRRVGAGSVSIGDGSMVVVLVLQQSFIDLEPVPRELAMGARVRLRGRVLDPYGTPELFVTRPDGSTVKQTLSARAGHAFNGSVDCPAEGRQQVELIGTGARGPQVLANFPVWCGIDAPSSVRIEMPNTGDVGVAETEQQIFDLVNRERREFGLPPVAWDERAAEVARGHSEDMRDNDFVGHVSPSTGGPSDRARAAGLASPLLLENVAFAHSADEAHAGLMNSPGHRANILNSEVTHVGIGVVMAAGGSNPELYATELFTRVVGPVDLRSARTAVQRALEAQRSRSKLAPLASDKALDSLAQSFAVALARSGGEAKPPSLERAARRYATVTTEIVVVADADRASSERLLRHGATAIGIGVAQGRHPQLGDNAVYVVIMIGHRGSS